MAEIETLSLRRIPMLTDFGRDDESNGERLAGCRDGAQHYPGGEFQKVLRVEGSGLTQYRCDSCGGAYAVNTQ